MLDQRDEQVGLRRQRQLQHDLVVAGQVIETLPLSRFANVGNLEPLGGGVFVPAAGEAPIAVAEGNVMQGYVEGSNVSPMREMIDLVMIARAYEANQKMISTRDQMMQRTLDTLG